MVRENEIRKAEVAVTLPPTTDAGLVFIGRIGTPWTSRMETPRQGRLDGPVCRLEIFEPGEGDVVIRPASGDGDRDFIFLVAIEGPLIMRGQPLYEVHRMFRAESFDAAAQPG